MDEPSNQCTYLCGLGSTNIPSDFCCTRPGIISLSLLLEYLHFDDQDHHQLLRHYHTILY